MNFQNNMVYEITQKRKKNQMHKREKKTRNKKYEIEFVWKNPKIGAVIQPK